MSVVEKVWTLSFFELRLLARRRQMILSSICLPVIGGVFFGLMSGSAAFPSVYGLLLILPIFALLFVIPQSIRADRFRVEAALLYASRAASRLVILIAQTLIYISILFVMGAEPSLEAGIPAGAISLSLVVGAMADRLRS